MIKAFVLTLLFTIGFTLLNSIGDGINFYKVFKYYKQMDLWHILKFGWMGCAIGAGWFLNDLIRAVDYNLYYVAFFVVFFCFVRLMLHGALMWKWRTP